MRIHKLALLAALAVTAAACDDDDDNGVTPPPPVDDTTAVDFTVTIANVSDSGTIAVQRLGGAVPLSPGVYYVYRDAQDPVFTVGAQADSALERLAEDGNNGPLAAQLQALADSLEADTASTDTTAGVRVAGTFAAAGGALIGPGDSVQFTVRADTGQRLQIMTMFAQSNDWFYTFAGGGIPMFTGTTPRSGDVTNLIALYDAGTEEDAAPGTGPNQAPAQAAPNTGPADDDPTIRTASTSGFTIPAATSVIRVTVTPQNNN